MMVSEVHIPPPSDEIRILLLSDLHEDEYALESIKAFRDKERFDHIFVAGDITKKSLSYADDLLEILSSMAEMFCLAVPGNCDPPELLELLKKKGVCAHGQSTLLYYSAVKPGFNLVGFGYSPPTPFHTYGELSEEEIEKGLRKWDINGNTLLLTHTPPYGVLDFARGKHIGSKAIRKIVEEKQPFALFCGHVHEQEGVEKIGNSYIVKIPAANNGRYAIATIKDKKIFVEFLKL